MVFSEGDCVGPNKEGRRSWEGRGAMLWVAPLLLAVSSCGMEGKPCSMPRDCCDGLACQEGDWAETSDFTCRRTGPKPGRDEYKGRLREYYVSRFPDEAALEEFLDSTLAKWDGREELL